MELSKAQDIEAGDGTTSVVVLAGSLLNASQTLLTKGVSSHVIPDHVTSYCVSLLGIHPTTISEAFQRAADRATKLLEEMSVPVDLSDRESLLKSATTALGSKV